MSILRGAAWRLLGAGTVLLGAATLAFAALQLLPGDRVSRLLGPMTSASPAVREQISRDYGLDRPVIVQYARYLADLGRGNLGTSYQLQQPVVSLIGKQLWPTVQLALAALVLALLIAAVSAIATAGRRPRLRAAVSAVELVAVSTPSFWMGILLLTVFSFRLRLFPVTGAEGPVSLVLPALALALSIAGVLSQVLRDGLETALAMPFVLTAQARGLSQTAVRLRHALRHAALPLVTLTGWLMGTLLGGVVPIETVFGRPGLGTLILQAVTSGDMPVVMGLVLLSALVFVIVSTVVDLLYLAIDPRLRAA